MPDTHLPMKGLALTHIYRHYNAFRSHFVSSETSGSLSFAQYTRLMVLALAQIFWTTSVSSACLAFNLSETPIQEYLSWKYVHSNFSRVNRIPIDVIPPRSYLFLLLSWYIVPISTLIFVSLFSFGEDAVKGYRECARWSYSRSGIASFVTHTARSLRRRSRAGLRGAGARSETLTTIW